MTAFATTTSARSAHLVIDGATVCGTDAPVSLTSAQAAEMKACFLCGDAPVAPVDAPVVVATVGARLMDFMVDNVLDPEAQADTITAIKGGKVGRMGAGRTYTMTLTRDQADDIIAALNNTMAFMKAGLLSTGVTGFRTGCIPSIVARLAG